MFGIGRNKAVVPPPAGWDQLGIRPDYTVLEFNSPQEVQDFCRKFGLQTGAHAYAQACTVPNLKVVAMPSKKAWPSEAERQDMIQHEGAHTYGLLHGPNRNTWTMSDGSPVKPLTPDMVAMLQGLYSTAKPTDLGVIQAALQGQFTPSTMVQASRYGK